MSVLYKTLLGIIILVTCSQRLFSQNLYVTKRDYSNPNNYIHSLSKLNKASGSVLNTYNYTATFPGFNGVESLTYNSNTKEIYGLSENLIIRYNVDTEIENSFTLSTNSTSDYGGIVIADNRLFVTKRDYSNPNNYVHSLLELDKASGSVIGTYNYTATFPGFNGVESLTYNPSSKEVFGISENLIIGYNIDTGAEISFTLSNNPSLNYGEIVMADNHLFVTQRDYSNPNNQVQSLLELDKTTGSIISTYNYAATFPGFNTVESLTYDPSTRELYGLSDNLVIGYNIDTGTEVSFTLSTNSTSDYGGIILIDQSVLSIHNLPFKEATSKIVKAYNLLGQEVPIRTFNQVIILLFENGTRKKVYQIK